MNWWRIGAGIGALIIGIAFWAAVITLARTLW